MLVHRAHDTICEEERYPGRLEKEEEIGDTFSDNVLATRSLPKHFEALKTAHELASELQYNLDNLETSKGREPTKDHSATIAVSPTSLRTSRESCADQP